MQAEFESIFADFFGRVAPSLDIQRTIEVTARERRTGCERLVTFHRRVEGAEQLTSLTVKVPAGLRLGMKLRLAGQGHTAKGRPPGDAYLLLTESPADARRRELWGSAAVIAIIAVLVAMLMLR